ncbi:metallophosphoesterase [Moraxella sp. ZJ142]|uniref:metallophosphoesterase n=1 Tax=Moraxella marmotae TaxID=3344520 RepID=UPI0035D48A13
MKSLNPITPTHQTAFVMVQLSDFHLTGRIGQSPSYQRFLQVLQMATTLQPDLFICTGDLVNDGNSDAYDWLFEMLQRTGTPYLAIAGNHDVTHEIGTGLPYEKRLHIPITPDVRLLNCHRQLVGTHHDWQLLLLDSSVGGETHGKLSAATLSWLDTTLANSPLPAIIALHHHPSPVGSAWIDAYQLANAADFWQIIQKHRHAHTIICGHVHQAQHLQPLAHHPVQLLSCPSTDRQFAPLIDEFTLDNQPAGCRVIQIDNTGVLSSYIKRMQNTH